MTAQVHERIIIEGVKTSMACCPPIPNDHPAIVARTMQEMEHDPGDFLIFSTACWRNYIGTWLLQDGRLYLASIVGRYRLISEAPIFADWVTTVLRIPHGEVLRYVHMEFATVFEFDRYLDIVNGLVVEERIIDNRKRDADAGEPDLPGDENTPGGDEL